MQYNKPFTAVTPELSRMFLQYEWPGNVRQLENLIKRMVVLGSEGADRPRAAAAGNVVSAPSLAIRCRAAASGCAASATPGAAHPLLLQPRRPMRPLVRSRAHRCLPVRRCPRERRP